MIWVTLHILREVKGHKVHDLKFNTTGRQCLHIVKHFAPPLLFIFLNDTLCQVILQLFLNCVLLKGGATLLMRIFSRFALLFKTAEKCLCEEVSCPMATTLQCSGLIQVKQEERQLWHRLFLEFRLVSLFDLFEVENGLPFRVGLVGTT